MKRTHRASAHPPIPRKLAVLVAAALTTGSVFAAAIPEGTSVVDAWRKTPISFERNDGQFQPQVLFVARGAGGDVALRSGEITIAPRPVRQREGRKAGFVAHASPMLTLTLSGANPSPEVDAQGEMSTRSHYYRGNDSTAYRENIPHYARVVMKDVYPSIDLALHGTQGALEYDFVVSPGADPRDIRLNLASAEQVFLDADGSLVMQVGGETLRQHAPIAFQQHGEERVPVAAHFELRQTDSGMEAGFTVGEYDAASPLVIDPLMTYSSYLGSSGGGDFGGYVGVDTSGNIYLAHTVAPNFAPPTDVNSSVNVTKLNPYTNTFVYSTWLDGSSYDVVQAMALGASGSGTNAMAAYITGYTASSDFPRCGACPAFAGGEDMFMAALNPAGTMVFSTLMGGSGSDSGNAIAVDNVGSVYVAGDTNTLDFPAANPFGMTRFGFFTDAFVVKFNAFTGMPTFSAILGGSGNDMPNGIAVDSAHNMYVVGFTQSRQYPTVNAAQTEFNLGGIQQAFLTKIAADGLSIAYSTFLGGSADNAIGVAVDGTNNAYVIGESTNASFSPWTSSRPFAGQRDVFYVRVQPDGAAGVPASFLGGSGVDFAGGIATNGVGEVFLTGTTFTGDFPVVDPLAGMDHKQGLSDAFVARFNGGGSLVFSTFLGGTGDDAGLSIALGGSGTYIGGRTNSADFPTVMPQRGYDSTGTSDNFVSRIDFNIAGPVDDDMSGDGKADILWRSGTDAVELWLMNGVTPAAQGTILGGGSGYFVKHVADFDGDGKSDILWESAPGATSMWLMNGLAHVGGADLLGGGTGWAVKHTADFNGDGKSDIVWEHTTNGASSIWMLDGTTHTGGVDLIGPDSGWKVKFIGDFNGDGKDDLLWEHSSGASSIWIMDGIVHVTGVDLIGGGTGWTVKQVGDFNGDGKTDIIWEHTDGTTTMWLMDGTTVTTGAGLVGPASGYHVKWTADFNGDGKYDLIWERTDGAASMWLMNGVSSLGSVDLIGPGSGYSIVKVRDLNGDGRADLIWQFTDGSTSAWLMNGTTAFSTGSLRPGSDGFLPSP